METNEINTENTPDSAPEAPPTTDAQVETTEAVAAVEAPEDPNHLGKLSPEEQQALLGIRQQSQQLLAKIGEHELLKSRLLARVEELDAQGQTTINGISKRLGVTEGQQWVALQDGTVRVVNNGGNASG